MASSKTIEPGTIKSYDAVTATGTVRLASKKLVAFAFTCFDSGRRTRPPREGEPVQVVFVAGSSTPLAVVSESATRPDPSPRAQVAR